MKIKKKLIRSMGDFSEYNSSLDCIKNCEPTEHSRDETYLLGPKYFGNHWFSCLNYIQCK